MSGSEDGWYGDTHPETLVSLQNLACNLRDQGKLVESEKYFRRALPGFESAYEWYHPRSIEFMFHWVAFLRKLGKYDEASDIEQKIHESKRNMIR